MEAILRKIETNELIELCSILEIILFLLCQRSHLLIVEKNVNLRPKLAVNHLAMACSYYSC